MNAFVWKVAACALLLYLAGLGVRCSIWTDSVQSCMRSNIFMWLVVILNAIGISIGVWLGVEAARKARRPWVGWLAGVTVASVLFALLSWFGFHMPDSDGEPSDSYEDNNYRR